MPDYRTERSEKLDFTVFILFGLGVALMSHVLEVFGEHTTSLPDVTAMLGVSLALLLLYARHALPLLIRFCGWLSYASALSALP